MTGLLHGHGYILAHPYIVQYLVAYSNYNSSPQSLVASSNLV